MSLVMMDGRRSAERRATHENEASAKSRQGVEKVGTGMKGGRRRAGVQMM